MDATPNSGLRVLLVDDEPDQIEMYRFGLGNAGFVVIEADGGQAAIAKAQTEQPDIIVLDLRMPDLDGWQVCAALKADRHTSHIPVVILTAAASPSLADEAQQAGCAAYLVKPCYPSELARTLRSVLSVPQPKFGV